MSVRVEVWPLLDDSPSRGYHPPSHRGDLDRRHRVSRGVSSHKMRSLLETDERVSLGELQGEDGQQRRLWSWWKLEVRLAKAVFDLQ